MVRCPVLAFAGAQQITSGCVCAALATSTTNSKSARFLVFVCVSSVCACVCVEKRRVAAFILPLSIDALVHFIDQLERESLVQSLCIAFPLRSP